MYSAEAIVDGRGAELRYVNSSISVQMCVLENQTAIPYRNFWIILFKSITSRGAVWGDYWVAKDKHFNQFQTDFKFLKFSKVESENIRQI